MNKRSESLMTKSLRILLLEDSPIDAELTLAAMADGGIACEPVRVETGLDFRAALEEGGFDLILADYALPSFDGVSALNIAQSVAPEIPFIFVSGTLGEELAIETLKSGATDYVVKQRIDRLVPSVQRALREAAERGERHRAEQELMKAKELAEAANRAKDQFLAVLSHELRTPLTPVLASVYALEDQEDISPSNRALVEIIRRNVELEARLIDDLLDLSRVNNGKLQLSFQEVDIHGAIEHVLENCRSDISEKGLHLALDLRATRTFVRADSARLQQVIWNLIRNAVKFTSTGGNIIVRTSNIGATRERIRLDICDDGIGMDAAMMPRIFDAFEQGGEQITHRFGGLGLGLSISKVLVDMHGGTLVAASEGRGRGSTFTIELETVTPRMPMRDDGKADGHIDPGGRKLRILIVEDHEDTRRVIQMLLERLGYEVAIAKNVRTALELATQRDFDLLISDIGLPDGTGLDLMRALVAGGRPIRAIALSGYGMEGDIRRSREAGFLEHLTKPISVRKLQETILEITERA
jgi:signal transduction histidine kinase